MKILLIAPLSNTHTIRWANEFSRRGHDVAVFSIHGGAPGLDAEFESFASESRLGKLGYLTSGPELRRVIRRVQPDIVHAHFASGYGFLCSTWLAKGSYLLSTWGSDVTAFPNNPLGGWVLRRNLARAGALLATSEYLRRETQRHTNQPVRLTPFGVDAETFRVPDEPGEGNPASGDRAPFRIGTARLLEPIYGIDTLIEAFALLRQRHGRDDTELLIAGDGPPRQRAHLEQLAADLGVAQAVRFLGWVPHADMPGFLAQLDAFCILSRRESFGVAALEAALCGLPVVGTNVGGLPETILHDETGFLVPPESPGEVAERLDQLASDGALRKRLGRAGREIMARRYDWNDSCDIMEQIYVDFLNTRGPSRGVSSGS